MKSYRLAFSTLVMRHLLLGLFKRNLYEKVRECLRNVTHGQVTRLLLKCRTEYFPTSVVHLKNRPFWNMQNKKHHIFLVMTVCSTQLKIGQEKYLSLFFSFKALHRKDAFAVSVCYGFLKLFLK